MIKESRCAIYTRKSTEEGLEQAFNSLDAQREACAAFIASQMHEGWVAVTEQYDDGGWSGGNMERPALKRLLHAVETGSIDVIVVYKVDRLTRSLADFAKIVDVLDKSGASFVSVTQAFNTTNSMGRLTLNVLLSFAQFEREVTGERIRDKIAASKAKGIWMGGVVPLGYDAKNRALEVNEEEAERVRLIFERYLELRSVTELERALHQDQVRSKTRGGRGGASFTRGALYTLLRNAIYTGHIAHKGAVYEGNHEAIIDADVFKRVQALLDDNRNNEGARRCVDLPNPLAGKIFDADGRPMSPSHTTKGGRRYRYYISRNARDDTSDRTRLPAGDIEAIVAGALIEYLSNAGGLMDALGEEQLDGGELQRIFGRATALVRDPKSESVLAATNTLLRKVVVAGRHLMIEADLVSLLDPGSDHDVKSMTTSIVKPIELMRSRNQVRLVIADREPCPQRDPALIRLLTKAYGVRRAVEKGSATMAELATAAGHNLDYYKVLLRISYLAPDLQSAILCGLSPTKITRQFLARTTLPHSWNEQRLLLNMESRGRRSRQGHRSYQAE